MYYQFLWYIKNFISDKKWNETTNEQGILYNRIKKGRIE